MRRSIIYFCSLSLFYILSLLLIPLSVQDGEIIKVDALVVSAENMSKAEEKARHLDLNRALTMMCNKKIPQSAKLSAHAQVDQLVTFRRILNNKAKADPGKFRHPSIDFEDFLEDINGLEMV